MAMLVITRWYYHTSSILTSSRSGGLIASSPTKVDESMSRLLLVKMSRTRSHYSHNILVGYPGSIIHDNSL